MPASAADGDAEEMHMRCLLVDDNEAFVEIARRILEPNGVKVTGTASNSAIARTLWVTEGTVEKHVGSILTKLRLPETDDTHRRVLAVLTFLNALLADLAEDPLDAVHRQPGLRQEAERGTLSHQVDIVIFGIRRDHDDRRAAAVTLREPAREIKTVFVAEHDIDEDDIWSQFTDPQHRFGAV